MIKYNIKKTTRFKKDIKRLQKQNMDFSEFAFVIDTIASGRKLAPKYLDHALGGNWKGFQDCHITPDWVLLYLLEDDVLVLTLTRTGSHSELDI